MYRKVCVGEGLCDRREGVMGLYVCVGIPGKGLNESG